MEGLNLKTIHANPFRLTVAVRIREEWSRGGYLKIVDALAPLVGEEGRGLSVAGLNPGREQASLVRLVPVRECHRL
jgi:hypothetical protein